MLEKKIKEDRLTYEKTLLDNENLKQELNDVSTKVKLDGQTLEEINLNYAKLKGNFNTLEEACLQKEKLVKSVTDRNGNLESEKEGNLYEIGKLQSLKDDIIRESMFIFFLLIFYFR